MEYWFFLGIINYFIRLWGWIGLGVGDIKGLDIYKGVGDILWRKYEIIDKLGGNE